MDMQNTNDKPYRISASIGCVVCDFDSRINIDHIISKADEEMYRYKTSHKRQRSS